MTWTPGLPLDRATVELIILLVKEYEQLTGRYPTAEQILTQLRLRT